MKRIMILGAGTAQMNLIRASREFGYYIIVCDMREGTEAEKLADLYHKVNYMDKEQVLKIAQSDKIDGIISNSEPAMLTVAYVAERMGLPGNSTESVEMLLSKSKFRDLQRSVGAYAPQHFLVSTIEELFEKAAEMKYPIIIKPTQSSGTRGTTKINSFNKKEMQSAFNVCKEFSRNNQVTVEEYVEMSSLRVNDADIFVLGDEFIWDGWLWEDRSPDTPMLPMTEIYPMAMPEKNKVEIMDTVNKILKASGVKHGEFNVETYYSTNGDLFVIEINPRQAGNYIPQLIEEHTGVSLTKLLVSTSVNDMSYFNFLKTFERENNYITLQVVFSKEDGIYDHLFIDEEIEKYVMWSDIVVKNGDPVRKGINASEAVAYIDLKFDSYEIQHKYTDEIEKYIYPVLKEKSVRNN